jgi:hypothetical protein
LVKRSEAGIEIAAARLVVHQPVATRDEVVRFRVTEALADDITHLSALAGVGSVEGVKGYSLTLGIDLDGIPSFNGADIAAVIPHLARTITAQQGK